MKGRHPQLVAIGMEVQATAREMTRLLEFGGEVGQERALRLSAAIIRDTVALQKQLSPYTQQAA